jgi:MFS family permease
MKIFGCRNVLIAGIVIFSMGLILLSAAPTLFPVLLVGRGVQGAGAAAMISVPHYMLKDMIPHKRRSFYNCVILSSSAIGGSLGFVLGGVFFHKPEDWRWVFYISAPFCFVLLIVTPFAVKPVGEELELQIRIMKVDWTGIGLFSGSMASLLLGLTWASSLQSELKWEVLFPLVAGTVGMIATILYERSGASRPFLPFHILTISPVTYICVFVQSILVSNFKYFNGGTFH